MKFLIPILLVASFALQNIGKLIVLINFEINEEYIAENLCEKRMEEDNCCQGSCHLKKELEEEDKKTDQSSTPSKDKFEKDQFCYNSSKLLPLKETILIITTYTTALHSGITPKVFDPPEEILFIS